MLVADMSALVSLQHAAVLDTVLAEWEVATTERVLAELRDTASYDDGDAAAATAVLERTSEFSVRAVDDALTSSRIDAGEGSAAVLARDSGADFLLTDDLRALPELQRAVSAEVAISPIVLPALVARGVLERSDARSRLDTLAERRGWLGAPLYERAQSLFEE